jgi:antitoxin CcdA
MRLDEFLRQSGMTLEQFGRKVGVSHSTVQRWSVGKAAPRDRGTMQAVMRASGGAVTAADFFPPARLPPSGLAETQAPFVDEARALGLDPEAITAKALAQAVREEKERRWQEDNKETIASWNDWIERNGVPLAKYRMF